MSTLVKAEPKVLSVGMAEVKLASHPESLGIVLGSCIGVALIDIRAKVAVLAHVVLPDANGRKGPPGKFADTAIPHMLDLLEERGAQRRGLMVKMTGGAQMFNGPGPMQIGEANTAAVRKALRAVGLAVQAEDVGGTEGRRVSLCCCTGQMTICRVGQDDLAL